MGRQGNKATSDTVGKSSKVVDRATKSAKHDERTEMVQITRREQRLRERLLTVDEDIIHDEKRIHDNGERRKARLTRRINQVRNRQEERLNRRDNSRLYHRSPLLYTLIAPFRAIGRGVRSICRKLRGRAEHHRLVTPHRSFYLTTHAQSVRQINISGYFRFIHEVGRLIWDNKWLYFKVLLALTIALLFIIGLGAQSNYIEVRDSFNEVGMGWFLTLVGLLTQAIITSMTVTDANRQAFAMVLVLVVWMALIYIVRHIYGGRTKMKLRDALYNSSGALVPLLVILVVVLIQMLPLAIGLISYSAVTGAGYINEGIEIENMAAWCIIAALVILTIYWMITSLLTLVTVTIPGIYPLRAYFETSVLVSGRRVKILLRILMMLLPLVVLWLVVLIPVILIDQAVQFNTVPFVQLFTTLLVAASLIWVSVYLYMLYRRLLDSPEQPVGTPNSQFVWPWLRKKRAAEIAKAVDHDDVAGGRPRVNKIARKDQKPLSE